MPSWINLITPGRLGHRRGIDAEHATIRDPSGRPVPLLQQGGAPIRELTA